MRSDSRRQKALVPPLLLWLLLALISVTATGCLRTMDAIDPRALPVTSPSARQLHAHVSFLASPELSGRQPGSIGNRQAAHYIEEQFRAVGLQPLPSLGGYRQTISERMGDNILGIIPPIDGTGTTRWIVIGAHYDHLGYPFLGADDNASSIAILIETGRSLAKASRYGILFVAFNSEESPYFGTPEMGSQFLFHHPPPEIGAADNLQAVIIMDLMGGVHWTPLKNAIFATGAEKSPEFYRHVTRTSVPSLTVFPVGIHLVEEIPDRGHKAFSDYDVFRNHQIPFLFLSAARSPRYHTAGDVASTLNYERMAATVEWLNQLVALMGQDETLYTFHPQRVEFADEVASFRGIVEQAIHEETLIPGTSRWSLRKLRQDVDWMRELDRSAPTPQQLERLERISIRVQCLIADYSGCFTF
ncbi:Peptidase_M28 domain-containing protein [Nitrospira defluvii]|uniref:Peptidase_M28 domain-containing protein n=1 Tax=Nitrospira defluvii TaxID=330214 RepID=A0ABM8RI02_9BACT|nr:Peptidase_M28 domain-containing protein [Nitrospira defluvii]